MDDATTEHVGNGRVETMSRHVFNGRHPATCAHQKTSEPFDDWFSRCHGSLHFIACRVLKGPNGAEVAVQKCWLTASRNRPTFDGEGDFRSWLLRVLINEALAILQSK